MCVFLKNSKIFFIAPSCLPRQSSVLIDFEFTSYSLHNTLQNTFVLKTIGLLHTVSH